MGAIYAHMERNLWAYIVGFSVLAVLAGLMRNQFGAGHHWGDLLALTAATAGGLIMAKSQIGFYPAVSPDEEG